MCEYCGCQDVPAIAALTSEHDEIRAVAREAARAAKGNDPSAASVAAARLLRLLHPHTEIEERALFPAMSREFADHVGSLTAEHRKIEGALTEVAAGPVQPGWVERLNAALAELFTHILREQDGLFPATLSVLTPAEWDVLDRVRTEVTARGKLSQSTL